MYQLVGKKLLLNLVIYGLFYRLVFRKILYYNVIIKVPIRLIWMALLFVSITSKIIIIGEENLRKIEEKNQKVIFVFWHSCYTLLLVSLRPKKAVGLVHFSFRGNYVAELATAFNYHIVRTSRSGKSVWQLMRKIEEGYSGFIAIDGPQGPPYQIKPGAIYIAKKTKATIVPLSIKAHKGIILRRRWDKHFIPLPFNKITVVIGKPINIQPGDSLEKIVTSVNGSLLES